MKRRTWLKVIVGCATLSGTLLTAAEAASANTASEAGSGTETTGAVSVAQVRVQLTADPHPAIRVHPVHPAVRPLPAVKPHPAVKPKLETVTVQSGDSLTAIGLRTSRTWQQLAGFNHIANWNLIYVGQVITVPPVNYVAGSLPAPATTSHPSESTYTYKPRASYTPQATTYQPAASYSSPSGGFQSCVAYRESRNTPTDEAGMYGILDSTWHSLGYSGNAGSASVSVQNQAFSRLYSELGTSPWGPYDGC